MAGYYRFSIGSFACTSLLDGTKEYQREQFFSNAPDKEVRAAMRSHGTRTDAIVTHDTYLYVNTGEHRILVDAGAGHHFPNTGKLLESMAAADIDPLKVDTVIVTHAHPDHVGGLTLSDGTPAFPNAVHAVSRDEWDYWFSELAHDQAREAYTGYFEGFFDFAQRHLEPIRPLVNLLEFSGERVDLYPGVSVFRAPGHTPGHMIVEFRSGPESLLYTADTVLSPIHLDHLSWRPVFDIEPGQAASTKRYVFDKASRDGSWVVGQHFPPFPSLGRVSRGSGGWLWQPVRPKEPIA